MTKREARGRGNQGDWAKTHVEGDTFPHHREHNDAVEEKKRQRAERRKATRPAKHPSPTR